MTRPMWAAMLAKMVAPLEPERAAKAIVPMLAMLGGYPDDAFTVDSMQTVCLTGRILPDGSSAPLNRVPTFGELEVALGKWWRHECEMRALRAAPIAREALPGPPAVKEGWTPEAAEHVRGVVAAFAAERSWNADGGRRDKPTPVRAHPLNDGELLALYEAMAARGSPGAAARVAVLRKRLGLTPRSAEAAEAGPRPQPSIPAIA